MFRTLFVINLWAHFVLPTLHAYIELAHTLDKMQKIVNNVNIGKSPKGG